MGLLLRAQEIGLAKPWGSQRFQLNTAGISGSIFIITDGKVYKNGRELAVIERGTHQQMKIYTNTQRREK